MRRSKSRVSLGTFALAFAIVLSPALMQTSDLTCAQGDSSLAALEVEVGGVSMIEEFAPEDRAYLIELDEQVESVIVRATASDSKAEVSYNLCGACPPPIATGTLAPGESEFTLEEVPGGHSLLKVWVRPPVGKAGFYGVFFTRPMECVQ